MNRLIPGFVVLLAACQPADEEPAIQPADQPVDSLSIVAEFATPESVQYDEAHDIYFVSNINGDPLTKDDNGFISRVRPDGIVEELKWVDGASPDVTLHAPKGIAIKGDTLFVTDIDSVRAFSISTGGALAARGVPGATFLNDLAIGPDGALYVSDSGLTTGFAPSGTDAIYRLDAGGPVAIVKGEWLGRPNGLAVGSEGVTIAPFGANVIMRVPAGGGAPDTVATLPQGSLDGLVRLDENNLLVTSWDAKTVYHVDVASGAVHPIVTGLESPADIGYDSKRRLILIPLFTQNRVEVRRAP